LKFYTLALTVIGSMLVKHTAYCCLCACLCCRRVRPTAYSFL